MKVDVSIVVSIRVEYNVSENLHSNYSVDEEQHPDEQDNIRESLE